MEEDGLNLGKQSSMETKISLIFLIALKLFSCQEVIDNSEEITKIFYGKNDQETNRSERQTELENTFRIPKIEVFAAKSPIKLDLIDFEDQDKIQQISDGRVNGIEMVIKEYYLNRFRETEKNLLSMEDIYLNTIQIDNEANQVLYWVIFKEITGKVNSQILIFDNMKKEYIEYKHDFNIHALYDEINGKLKPSNLKESLEIDFPEIELIDFDGDKYADYRLRRLYHNGTANAFEEMIIEVKDSKVDTLKFERNWIRN